MRRNSLKQLHVFGSLNKNELNDFLKGFCVVSRVHLTLEIICLNWSQATCFCNLLQVCPTCVKTKLEKTDSLVEPGWELTSKVKQKCQWHSETENKKKVKAN